MKEKQLGASSVENHSLATYHPNTLFQQNSHTDIFIDPNLESQQPPSKIQPEQRKQQEDSNGDMLGNIDQQFMYKKTITNMLQLIEGMGFKSCIKNSNIQKQFEEVNKPTLRKTWENMYQYLMSSLFHDRATVIFDSNKKTEEEESSLNKAVVYDSEAQPDIQQSLTDSFDQSHEQSSSILMKMMSDDEQSDYNPNNSSSNIIGTPIVKLLDQVYPPSQNRFDQFKFSLMEESSFENSVASKNILQFKQDDPNMLNSLVRLNHAQTELTYLCQHKNWRLIFQEGVHRESVKADKKSNNRFKIMSNRSISNTPKFTCRAQVDTIYHGHIKKIFGYCEMANSKKQARHISSILCLYELYHFFQGLWDEYQVVKMEKPSLIQDSNGNNQNIFLNSGISFPVGCKQNCIGQIKENGGFLTRNKENSHYFLNSVRDKAQQKSIGDKAAKVFSKNTIDTSQDPQLSELLNYIDGLQSTKKELYYFIAQNKSLFLVPEWEYSRRNNGYWEVKGSVKNDDAGQINEIRYMANDRNKKVAQQKICNKILFDIYSKYGYLFKRFLEIKHTKGLC